MSATREILATHVPKGVNPVAGGCLFPLDSARFPHLHASPVITTHVENGNCESVINILNNHVCSGRVPEKGLKIVGVCVARQASQLDA